MALSSLLENRAAAIHDGSFYECDPAAKKHFASLAGRLPHLPHKNGDVPLRLQALWLTSSMPSRFM
jgi:hypothetical protein